MVQASEETGKKLMVNHVLRFYARFQRIKALVDSGELGEIYAAEGDYLHNTVDRIRSGWVKTRPSVMTGGGIHLIDQLLWLVGDVEEVFCYSTRGILKEKEVQSPDCMMAILKFKNGCVGKAMTNMAAQRPALHNLILFGTEGVVMNGKPDGVLYRGHRAEPEAITDAYAPVSGSAKAVGMAHLLDCIEQDTEPLVNVREGAQGIAVCEAINESYRTGKPVQVEEV
jgi:predicted dehydrogenase